MSESTSQKFDASKHLIDLKGKDYLPVAARLIWFRLEKPNWGIETQIVASDKENALVRASIKDETGRTIATASKTQSAAGFRFGHIEKAETGAIGRALALCGFGTQFTDDFDEGDDLVDSPIQRNPAKEAAAPKHPMADRAYERMTTTVAGIEFNEPKPKKVHPIEQKFASLPYDDTPPPDSPPQGMDMSQEFPDEPGDMFAPASAPRHTSPPGAGDYVIQFGKFKGQKLHQVGGAELKSYVKYLTTMPVKDGKPMSKNALELVEAVQAWMGK